MLADLGIDAFTLVLLGLALLLALSFEFVNGFHDTANAVATVIYTKSLRPSVAVVWSGAWNLIGVLTSSGAVAFGIVALLPVELVLNVGSGAGFAMVFALLLSAIIWNLGTWYLGLPASSSHSLIGAIVGVGLMNSLISPTSAFGEGVNWSKVADTAEALIFSPLIGFFLAGGLLLLAKLLVHIPALYAAPEGDRPPPWWIRGLLIFTCTGVSFAHGSNDGQKGMGLIMLILVGLAPVAFALKLDTTPATLAKLNASSVAFSAELQSHGIDASIMPHDTASQTLSRYLTTGNFGPQVMPALSSVNASVQTRLQGITQLSQYPAAQRRALRMDVYLLAESTAKLIKLKQVPAGYDAKALAGLQSGLKSLTSFIPVWVKVAVALALGFGTMIGWKRIVVTVGEKIGKAHLTYAQGACAELVAFATIEAADVLGLPVSTTHVLSSGIAGTMAANRSGLQRETLRNILLAWVLTLPACMLLGAGLFGAGLLVVFRVLGVH
jgi:PiT family inorganic phosphate transporter